MMQEMRRTKENAEQAESCTALAVLFSAFSGPETRGRW